MIRAGTRCWRWRRHAAAASLVGLVAACQTAAPGRPEPAGDTWEVCAAGGEAALRQARALLAGGDAEAALPLLRDVVAACPDHVSSHLLYIDTAEGVGGDAAAAMRSYYAGLEDDGRSPVFPYVRARLAEHDAGAKDLLEEALRRNPSFYYGYLSLGRLMATHDRTELALENFENALAARKDFADAHLELAYTLADLGRFEEAEQHHANYARARPTDRVAQRVRAHILIHELGRLLEARGIVEGLLEDDPDDVGLLLDKAAIHWKDTQYDEAARIYREVLRREPANAKALLNLGNLHYYPLARGSDERKRAAWAVARTAYRCYLQQPRNESLFDVVDTYFAVPKRLAEIDDLLGAPPDDRPARVEDLLGAASQPGTMG